jgi:hypothetical protein
MKAEPVWIEFLPFTLLKRKTTSWMVYPKLPAHNQVLLGTVHFSSRWRCYSFFPEPGTWFEKSCLRVIADFCEQQTKEWRTSRAKPKTAKAEAAESDPGDHPDGSGQALAPPILP